MAKSGPGKKRKPHPKTGRKGPPPTLREGSLLQPSAMGGIIGGKGYDFQNRYIACHIPKWLLDGNFNAIFHEGTGDVDLLLTNGAKNEREHIQVKDHAVNGAELREVIETFFKTDRGMQDTYTRFTLACPGLGGDVQPLKNGLDRFRDTSQFYAAAPNALNPTVADLRSRIENLGLDAYSDFILTKVHFHVAPRDYHDDDSSCEQFVWNLLAHPEHKSKLVELVKSVYSPVLREVANHRGKVIDRATLHALIEASLSIGGTWSEAAIDIDVHNWTGGSYERPAEHVLDWTSHFDRATRSVPTSETWQDVLLPDLIALQKQLAAVPLRLIRMRGKATLTTGVALGAVFPQVGGWIFDIDQHPSPRPWRSNAPPRMQYHLTGGAEILVDPAGDSIALVLNVKGSATAEVEKYISAQGLPVKAVVSIAPERGSMALSILDDREAMSVAVAARNQIDILLNKYGVRMIHLFYYGPFALSVFLGQHLTSIGRVQLYEFQDPSYVPSLMIRT